MHVYLITDLLHGKQYVGAEKGNDPEYFGSGKLIREAIEKFGKWNFKKEIIIDSEYIDSWEECLMLEATCILSFNTLVPNGYNILFWNWPIPVEVLSKAGEIGGKIVGRENVEKKRGMFALEMLGMGGRRTKELGIGIFAPGMSSKGGKKTKELGIGVFAPENLGKGGEKLFEEKRGIFAPGMQSKAGKIGGKIGGKRTHELKVGIHAPGMQSKGGKIGGKITGRKLFKEKRGMFAPGMASKGAKRLHELYPGIGGKNSVHILFETDGSIQQCTLGAINRA